MPWRLTWLQWNKAKSRVHYALPKVREFIHRATWAMGTPERKKLDELFKNHIGPHIPFPQMDKVQEQLENLRKDRQVLSAHGVAVYQECKSISAEVQGCLRRLQSNAAARAVKKRGAARAKKASCASTCDLDRGLNEWATAYALTEFSRRKTLLKASCRVPCPRLLRGHASDSESSVANNSRQRLHIYLQCINTHSSIIGSSAPEPKSGQEIRSDFKRQNIASSRRTNRNRAQCRSHAHAIAVGMAPLVKPTIST